MSGDDRGGVPARADVLAFLRDNPGRVAKRDIARAFGVTGADRIELKRLLRDMEDEGQIPRKARRKTVAAHGWPPPVGVLIAEGPDENGDMFASPADWTGEDEAPRVLVLPQSKEPAPGKGDRLLCKISRAEAADHRWEARLIKRIGSGPRRRTGLFRADPRGGGRLSPTQKGDDREWAIPRGMEGDAQDGDLILAEALPTPRRALGLPPARIVEVLGSPEGPAGSSMIAIEEHGIPTEFPDAVLEEAEAAGPLPLGDREDLRGLPLVTIDPEDARDHDDAVCAIPDEDPANPGGFHVWVAIADVAAYVRPYSALDREARKRGNSTYFPERVVPMLPERLSADLCSLMPGVDRPCIAVCMRLSADGQVLEKRFTRGMMRSAANIAYQRAQAAEDGALDAVTEPVAGPLRDLFAAWRAATAAQEGRGPLNLDLPERKIVLAEDGSVAAVRMRERLDAHRLIETFMILANVCAAEVLEEARRPLVYRVHEEPGPAKLDALREAMEGVGMSLPKGQVLMPRHLNKLLDQAAGGEFAEFVNISVLRAQTQAYYAPENLGHFGLALRRYAHFTSPIRRYADLIVHRALIAAHRWGPDPRADGLGGEEAEGLKATAEHISFTERRSMAAERDTVDRCLAAYLKERVGDEFEGRISGVARFGLFIKLDETGADGLVPISTISREYWRHDPETQTLTGEDSGTVLGLGQKAVVRLAEAVPVTGGLMFELLEVEGEPAAKPRRGRPRGKAPRRKLSKARIKAGKDARKARRRP